MVDPPCRWSFAVGSTKKGNLLLARNLNPKAQCSYDGTLSAANLWRYLQI